MKMRTLPRIKKKKFLPAVFTMVRQIPDKEIDTEDSKTDFRERSACCYLCCFVFYFSVCT